MRLPTLAALAPLAALTAADYMDVTTTCNNVGNCYSTGTWYTDFAFYYGVDANEGCRDSSAVVPSLRSLCMDWGNQRAHFFFDGEGKRCLRKNPDYQCILATCTGRWKEIACTW